MKQLLQNFRSGTLELVEAPVPAVSPKSLVIQTSRSLISVGTEKMLVEFGKASLLNKARQQPERVRQVLDKIKTDGLIHTLEAVWSKLNEPIPLGYSNVGRITEVGSGVTEFTVGERVVSNGSHAEFVKVPWTLAARIPDGVSDEEAAFAVTGAISLEGIRLVNPTLGETVVVVGLGLLGQLTVQLLQANGCRVIGTDIAVEKVELARQFGAETFLSRSREENVDYVLGASGGIGADAVIITASTPDENLLSQCALMSRKRGRIVLVGVVPITVPRNLFYEKELSFQVSSSYGPGRYDPLYEEQGIDYPPGYVRWTAKRNMEAFLFLLQEKKVAVQKLITHRFPFSQVVEAYRIMETEKPLGIILEYSAAAEAGQKRVEFPDYVSAGKTAAPGETVIGFIGVGNFARAVLLPALQKAGAKIKTLVSSSGAGVTVVAKKYGIPLVTSRKEDLWQDAEVNTVFIATRHASHAALVREALQAGKHVFVEKPLALRLEELQALYPLILENPSLKLLVGFNRRFSPFAEKLKAALAERSDPLSLVITVNAGAIPADHWVHDPEVGGGRIIGEGCHFVDLARYLVGHPITRVVATTTQGHSISDEDKTLILLNFQDGSQAAIHYLANGSKKFPKERVEVFSSNRVFVIDNFKQLQAFGSSLKLKSLKQDKGHQQEVERFLQAVANDLPSPLPAEEIFEVHLATLAVKESLHRRGWVELADLWKELGTN